MSTPKIDLDAAGIQKLILYGYGSQRGRHFVLKVVDAPKARLFLRELLQKGWITAATGPAPSRPEPPCLLNVGFTYRGLVKLELPAPYLHALQEKAGAFVEGAYLRAARRLADTGESAADNWHECFKPDAAHVLLSIHADTEETLRKRSRDLERTLGADGLEGLSVHVCFDGKHLTTDENRRTVHFGYRDGITSPRINSVHPYRDSQPGKHTQERHEPGEFLLGYKNDEGFNPWVLPAAPRAVGDFFRNGSFCAFRKIEQDEKGFRAFVERKARELKLDPEYLKAKMCGRWSNGPLLKPDADSKPPDPAPSEDLNGFDFTEDEHALGCPFGAHIRRMNPRKDPVVPIRRRPLIRRGMPYGPAYAPGEKDSVERGLLGLFFCASLEDQFEHLLAEWGNKNPMGPDNRGNAKDPLVGNHEDCGRSFLHIPREKNASIELEGFTPFATTRGTLYAFYPSVAAIRGIAECSLPSDSDAAGDSAPADRFCDLVMTGGVTSGIVYPPAIIELAKAYRFKNIAGTSAGAMAAALTAAAEYQRRIGSVFGFEVLRQLPGKLAERVGRGTRLRSLFQPAPSTARLFQVFVDVVNRFGTSVGAGRPLALAWTVAKAYWRPALLGLIVAIASILIYVVESHPVDRLAALGAVLVCVIAVLISIGITAWSDVRSLLKNNFGLCTGGQVDEDASGRPALITWLHEGIQAAAGRKPDDAPLTFGDLWSAPGFPPAWLDQPQGADAHSIELQMVTTNLTHGRPYLLPMTDASSRLFFKPDELKPYFPDSVLNYLVQHSVPYRPEDPLSDPPAAGNGNEFLQLPDRDLPVIVATRLSLSFPFLFSAVPLWAIDYEQNPADKRQLHKCWFSDGGICSNFPIHLFDSFIPEWPTFGITLGARSKYWPSDKDAVWLPAGHKQGRGDSWDRFGCDTQTLSGLFGFLGSIIWTAKDWSDKTLMRMPGVRDRVVRVGLSDGEGELNLNMTAETILKIANQYGTRAGEVLVDKFVDGRGGASRGWNEHRWVRFQVLLAGLKERIAAIGTAAELCEYATPLSAQISQARREPPLAGEGERALSAEQADALSELLAALKDFEKKFAPAEIFQPDSPMPPATLCLRPRL